MVNNEALGKIINASGYKKGFVAQQMGVSAATFSNKLAGRTRWTADECSFMREFFGIPTDEATAIFFAEDVE